MRTPRFRCPILYSVSGSGSQFGIGLIAGYNWQNGNQVFGLETDIDLPSGYDYFGTLRGRYGVVSGNWLYYGTAGLSFTSAPGSGYAGYNGFSGIGYIVGAGAETKINSRLAAGFEALYYGFTDDTQNFWGIYDKHQRGCLCGSRAHHLSDRRILAGRKLGAGLTGRAH